MRRLFAIVALVLSAAWLPATLHCAMETTGVLEPSECCETHDAPAAAADDHCDADHCAVLEAGAPRDHSGCASAPMPTLPVIEWLAPIPSVAATAARHLAAVAEPDVGHFWLRAERVVAPARAP